MDFRSAVGSVRVYGITTMIIGGLWAYAHEQSLLEPERISLPGEVQLTPLPEAVGNSEILEELADAGE